MKKISIFLGIFIFSLLSFGIPENEATVTIEAEFLAPLKVEVIEHASFGTIIAQNYSFSNKPNTSSGNSGAHSGKIKISGAGDVKIQWADKNNGTLKDVVNTENLNVILTNKNNSSQKITAEFNLLLNEGEFKNIESLKLNENSPKTLLVSGTLIDISSNTPSGTYEGAILFRVEYDDNSI